MMRIEHEQMRELVAELLDAAQAEDQERFLDVSDTLLVLMEQHNLRRRTCSIRCATRPSGATGLS